MSKLKSFFTTKPCYCMLFAILGIILLAIKKIFVDIPILGNWNKISWIAAVMIIIGFSLCGIIGCGCKNGKCLNKIQKNKN